MTGGGAGDDGLLAHQGYFLSLLYVFNVFLFFVDVFFIAHAVVQ